MDEEQKTGQETASKISGTLQAIGNAVMQAMRALWRALKVAFKYIAKFIKWIFTIITSNIYVLIAVIAIILIMAAIIVAVALIENAGYDKDKGTMTSIGGVTGTHFYGERFLYYDDVYCSEDLADKYLEFTYNILNDVNNSTTISIDFTASYQTSSQINAITMSFASALSGESVTTLLEHTSIIDHYGFTEEERGIVLENMATYLSTNGYSSEAKESLLSKLRTSYDNSFAYMKNVCKKIMIKDYILEPEKTAENIEKKNYFGFIYMPKQMVTLEETSFVFAVDEEKTVDFKMGYTNGVDNVLLEEETADSTWFNEDGLMEKALNTTKTKDYLLNQFTAIDESDIRYLSEGKTLFDILKDDKFLIYFKDTAGDYSAETLLNNVNTGNYLYMQLTADAPYNMAEMFVTVKSY